MKITAQRSTLKTVNTDALVIFIPEDAKEFNGQMDFLKKYFKNIFEIANLEEFKGKKDQLLKIFSGDRIATGRLFLVGTGQIENVSLELFRRASAAAAKKAQNSQAKNISFFLPQFDTKLKKSEIASAIAEGTYLSLYKYDKYFTEKKEHKSKISEITICDSDDNIIKELKKPLSETQKICEAVVLTRNLSNAPANEIYPETLAERAKESADKFGYSAVIWDKKKIEKEGFGGLLAVNSGSSKPPRFIILEYNRGKTENDTIVLIGKGVTFDSGGISIKPSAGMAEMKMDMAGAAAVIGTIEATARLKLPVHLVGLIPATENLPSGTALKPGDIIKHYGGITSEVDNTDAEGRLILADVIAYAANFKPAVVIDLATLTGACVVALGQHATGMFGNNNDLMNKLKSAGEQTYERVWELPLFEEYEKQIKSDIADVKNIGGKWAGAITAALFLKRFIPKNRKFNWVHLDIAGTAMLEENLPYSPKGGSGVGVRLLIEFLRNWK
ncbi:MAG: leucyl aminopeptidase [Ignavibacteriales bacterium]|nr:leucyl aminopeptidase [Ignavibacteriales bacterium]